MNGKTIELLPINIPSHRILALLRVVNGVWRKKLGRQSGKRASPMEQTPPARTGTSEKVGQKDFDELASEAEDSLMPPRTCRTTRSKRGDGPQNEWANGRV